ncbi:hypothetical protein [Streptomyces sp. NBC_00162]|uniref:hypothetical protein n=1 Tax=Streptomyces sp. NBC_00162 TaxID=2903629 RepID=UPI00214C2C81|nr:hypothetical protein [Streptomyces sp. NBC_00162]UUU44310.1 hypothetical protein JIW86_39575 [Streptomyces sp. NBC_00162]
MTSRPRGPHPETVWTVVRAALAALSAGAAVALATAELWGQALRGPAARRTAQWAGQVTT